MNGKIFISYSWTEPSGSIVNNWLKPCLKDAGITCMIDKDDCGYNANIDKFEAEIVNAAKVILVVSLPFLTSLDCMYEASLAVSKCDVEKQIFLINLPAYNFRADSEGLLLSTASFFTQKKAEEEELLLKIADAAKGPVKKRLRMVNTILDNLNKLWDMLGSKNSGELAVVSQDGFKMLCDNIKESLSGFICDNS